MKGWHDMPKGLFIMHLQLMALAFMTFADKASKMTYILTLGVFVYHGLSYLQIFMASTSCYVIQVVCIASFIRSLSCSLNLFFSMQLAVALDKVRNDHSLLVWDVESRPSKYRVAKILYVVLWLLRRRSSFICPFLHTVE